jgi:hypothetical protein
MKDFDPELRKEMLKGINLAARYLHRELRSSVQGLSSKGSFSSGHARRAAHTLRNRKESISILQASGAVGKAAGRAGLRDTIARNTRIVKKDSGLPGQVGVRIAVQGMPPDQRKLPRHMDKGAWRHPVMGDPDIAWVTQAVSPSGWWSNPVQKSGPATRVAVEHAINDAMRKLAASITTAA